MLPVRDRSGAPLLVLILNTLLQGVKGGVYPVFWDIVTFMDKIQEKIDKVAKTLLGMPAPQERNRPIPTKKDLERKFVMRVDRKGKPSMREV